MNTQKLIAVLALIVFTLPGCVGRLTGGGTLSGLDLAGNGVSAQISSQNIAGAICHPELDDTGALTSNIPDTVRGDFTYRETSPNSRSFTCTLGNEPIAGVIPNNFYGSGQYIDFEFQGRVTQYTGDWGASPPVYCAGKVFEGDFPGLTPSKKGTTLITVGLIDPEAQAVLYQVYGFLETGNVQYHLANPLGICSSSTN